MNTFEYLFVIVSILLGLGMTELLGGVGRILRGELKAGGLHTLWIVIVLQLQLQLAWGLWGLRDRAAWRYPEFLLLLTGPALLYMMAAVLFPTTDSIVNDEHLILRRRPFFLLNGGYVVFTGVGGWFLFAEPFAVAPIVLRLVPLVCLVTLAVTANRTVHWVLALAILAGHAWWTYLFTFVMGATPVGR